MHAGGRDERVESQARRRAGESLRLTARPSGLTAKAVDLNLRHRVNLPVFVSTTADLTHASRLRPPRAASQSSDIGGPWHVPDHSHPVPAVDVSEPR
jgi:hypothetical protein